MIYFLFYNIYPLLNSSHLISWFSITHKSCHCYSSFTLHNTSTEKKTLLVTSISLHEVILAWAKRFYINYPFIQNNFLTWIVELVQEQEQRLFAVFLISKTLKYKVTKWRYYKIYHIWPIRRKTDSTINQSEREAKNTLLTSSAGKHATIAKRGKTSNWCQARENAYTPSNDSFWFSEKRKSRANT